MRKLFFGLFFMMSGAQAAWLQVCPDGGRADGPEAVITRADGPPLRLAVRDKPAQPGAGPGPGAGDPACRAVALPVAAGQVAAILPLAPAQSAALGERIVVSGSETGAGFAISTIDNAADAPAPEAAPLPLRENLLPHLRLQTFGAEERVRARIADGRLELQCGAGNRPAGAILHGPWRMPLANLELQVSGAGDGRFEVLAADARSAAREAAALLGHFSAGTRERTQGFGLRRPDFDRGAWHSFSIACPAEQAMLTLSDLRLLPRAAGPVAARSAWVWNPNAWRNQPEEVFAHAQKHGVQTLFVSVPLADGAVREPAALASFVRAAGERGIGIWPVDGDPRMVLPSEHAATLARVRAYAAYNAAAAPDARLRGVQFDIEPYLLPGYALAQAQWERQYLQLAGALQKAAGDLPLEMVVPFWWAGKAALMQGLAQAVSGLTVMDYRTDAREIERFAAPFLDWAALHGKRVRIALEAGPLEAETQRRYAKAASGELWLVKFGEMDVAVLLKQAHPNPNGPAYRQTGAAVADGAATTFHGDPARLVRMLPALEEAFSAWEGFDGMALHELK